MNNKLSYGVLASGGLGASCLETLIGKCSIRFVFTDKLSAAIIDLCNSRNIPLFVGNPRNGLAKDFLAKYSADIILSINYLFIVEADILAKASKYAINFHGSLLPKYRGRTPHVWAIINNEQQTGITAHLMTTGCDEGDVIYQEVISIGADDTGGTLLERYKERYPLVIDQVIEMAESDTIIPVPQKEALATSFGKRGPEDGALCWSWQKERIKNWVRAQAKPYPGAFTFCGGEKVIIHKISFSELGFQQSDRDGLILSVDPAIVVKTNNGAIVLEEIETSEPIAFKKGDIFYAGNAN